MINTRGNQSGKQWEAAARLESVWVCNFTTVQTTETCWRLIESLLFHSPGIRLQPLESVFALPRLRSNTCLILHPDEPKKEAKRATKGSIQDHASLAESQLHIPLSCSTFGRRKKTLIVAAELVNQSGSLWESGTLSVIIFLWLM